MAKEYNVYYIRHLWDKDKFEHRGQTLCPFMSLNVTSAEISLSSWFFPLMERKNLAALPVVKTIPQGLCQRFHAGRPTRAPAPGCHRPVPRLQAGFHEQVDLRSRELWPSSGSEVWSYGDNKSFFMEGEQKEKEKRMSGWWILVIIAIWFLLQAYILPKFGISTWLRNSCQLGSPEDKITEAYTKSDK